MKPSKVANYLRKIATTIEKSRKPDKSLVIDDIKQILAALQSGRQFLVFRSKIMDAVWELGDDSDIDELALLVNSYNRKLGGGALLADEPSILDKFPGGVDRAEEYGGLVNNQEAEDMLTGILNGFTKIPMTEYMTGHPGL